MTRSNGPGLVFFDICFDSLDKVFYAGENIKGCVKMQLERPKIFAGINYLACSHYTIFFFQVSR